jgi:hypothetical protein
MLATVLGDGGSVRQFGEARLCSCFVHFAQQHRELVSRIIANAPNGPGPFSHPAIVLG